jgi:hypothetical protein
MLSTPVRTGRLSVLHNGCSAFPGQSVDGFCKTKLLRAWVTPAIMPGCAGPVGVVFRLIPCRPKETIQYIVDQYQASLSRRQLQILHIYSVAMRGMAVPANTADFKDPTTSTVHKVSAARRTRR